MTHRSQRVSGPRTFVLAVATAALAAGSTLAMADPSDHLNNNIQGYQPTDRSGDHSGDRSGNHGRWGQDYGNTGHAWHNGDRIGYNDWSSAQPVDYRAHHLRRPPNGYAWRESNGQYVLAALATGAIVSVILNSGR